MFVHVCVSYYVSLPWRVWLGVPAWVCGEGILWHCSGPPEPFQ